MVLTLHLSYCEIFVQSVYTWKFDFKLYNNLQAIQL